ncbi:putative pyroglutamyl peptidase type I [Aspergillus undulatus]|uniref:putative pyroglutamyl peptidase type I n=1 Tax=Aspergillus undulatus TaxID=1810928 RepID=UPI003CCDA1CC
MGDSGSGVHLTSTPLPRDLPSSPADPEEISVLVTGFGPFKTNIVNASHLIASSLPSSLSVPLYTADGTPAVRRIAIHVHPSPISVAYSAVRTAIPAIMEDYVKTHSRQPDIVIHMGIAATRNYYSIESKAHRDAYNMPDILGRAGYEDGEKPWRERSLPNVLTAGRSDPATEPVVKLDLTSPRTNLNPHPPDMEFLKTWKGFAPSGADLRISEDAGRYLCEFIFYTSLSLALREGRDRNVAFFHVPSACRDEDVETGREVAIGLIKALVDRWVGEKV